VPIPTSGSGILPEDVLVVYEKSGGFAGLTETLVVHQGGLVELESRFGEPMRITVEHAVIQPIRRTLEQREFAELDSDYPAQGADLIAHTITARDINGNVKTVTAVDGAEYPPVLELLITMLEQLRGGLQ
jgi:hypothetical protein